MNSDELTGNPEPHQRCTNSIQERQSGMQGEEHLITLSGLPTPSMTPKGMKWFKKRADDSLEGVFVWDGFEWVPDLDLPPPSVIT